MNKEIYSGIVECYKKCGSTQKTSIVRKVALATVLKVLITEGLWKSELSERIAFLKSEGKSINEIAKELFISEKCVEAYLPYKRAY